MGVSLEHGHPDLDAGFNDAVILDVNAKRAFALVNLITETIEADRYPFSPHLREGGTPGLCIGASEGTGS
jgi:hypothetical protein